jgi:hypothetical protein
MEGIRYETIGANANSISATALGIGGRPRRRLVRWGGARLPARPGVLKSSSLT